MPSSNQLKGISALAALIFFLSGCGTFVPVINMAAVPPEQINASNKIQVFTIGENNHPEIANYLGNITTYSCKHMTWDPPPSTGDALAQLRLKALELGADAITDVSFNGNGTDALGTNCWASVQASGIAVKFKRSHTPKEDKGPDLTQTGVSESTSTSVGDLSKPGEPLDAFFNHLERGTPVHLSMLNGDEMDMTFIIYEEFRQSIWVRPTDATSVFSDRAFDIRKIRTAQVVRVSTPK